MNKWLFPVFVALLLAGGVTRAEQDSTDNLLLRLQQLQRVSGEFTQRQFDEADELLRTSSGRFSLLRPGYFRWDITTPDSQLIIADPDYIWHYDRDLATVTRRRVDASAQMAPLQVLGGGESIIRERFTIERLGPDSFRLIPGDSNPGFASLVLSWKDTTLQRMEIVDNLGQRIEVEFSALDTAAPLTPADFAFTPPGDADLFYHD